jgi:hypothetical protein
MDGCNKNISTILDVKELSPNYIFLQPILRISISLAFMIACLKNCASKFAIKPKAHPAQNKTIN